VLVRGAVERELGLAAAPRLAHGVTVAHDEASVVKLSIRLTAADAARLDAGARRAGLSRGAYITSLLADDAVCSEGSASRVECVAALVTSSAALSTLSRNLHHLTLLLREGDVRAAQEYRAMLDSLGADVRAHLAGAAGLLAELRPRRPDRAGRHVAAT
jgi:hypothetical protein